ncbi:MAG: glycosyltransferase family 2 protein [Candidatus Zixiibacteriota bacterium]
MKKLSVVVITRNEEKNIRRCLEAVTWAEEIVLVDNESTDRTREIAAEFGARIFTVGWGGYGTAKRTGVEHAEGEWILSVDADEVVSEELAAEIKDAILAENDYCGYTIPRKTNFLGRWINHCGWYPDRLLRLFKKNQGNFNTAMIHEKVELDGRVGSLRHDLLHYSYPDLESYFIKFNRYTTLGAEAANADGKRAGWFDILFKPPVSFFKHYVIKRGFLDGWEGLLISFLSSTAVLIKYAKLRAMKKPSNERLIDCE